MKKLMLLFVAIMTFALCSSAQGRKITGWVVSADDDEPLVGATVMPIGGGTGTATNIDGQFSLSVPASVKELRISYVGMHEQTVPAEDGITVKLVNSINRLDEVMVVAYGTAKKSEYTGAASVVGADQLQDALVTTATSALSGKVSGVQVLSSNGQPGAAPTVIIRGVGTVNASSAPLYVVDGLPMSASFNISNLNPQEIESMTVQKDAASTSLYGARGANGVIMITTKRGKTDNVKVTVDARWGANTRAIPNYDVVKDTDTYVKMLGQAHYNNMRYNLGYSDQQAMTEINSMLGKGFGTGYQIYTLPGGSGPFFLNNKFDINPAATLGYADAKTGYYYTPDDFEKGTYHNGFRQEYVATVENATDRLNMFVSVGYTTNAGLVKHSHFNRLNTRTSFEYQLKPWVKLGTNMSYVYTDASDPDDQTKTNSTGNAFLFANQAGPVYPMYARDLNGQILYDASTGLPVYDYGSATYGTGGKTRNWMSGGAPVAQLAYNKEQYLTDNFMGKWFATVTPLKGLNITGTIGYGLNTRRYNSSVNKRYGQFVAMGGSVSQEVDRYRDFTTQILASYARTFNEKHNMSILGGYESTSTNIEYVYGSARNMYFPDDAHLSNVIDDKDIGGAGYSWAIRGWIANAKYNFDERYYATFGFRRDASSRFAPAHRWGSFFSGSLAWDIAHEKFMENVNWVDMLKIRGSYGQNGNDNLGDGIKDYFPYLDIWRLTGADGVWSDGSLYHKGNPDLTWEKQNNWNVGLDFSLWNGRLSGAVDYYQKQTDDMLYNRPTPSSLGYSSIPMNVGSLRNYGVEVELEGTLIQTKDITWTANFNITIPNSKVIKLHPDLGDEWITGSRIYRIGEPIYQLYLLKYAGVDPSTGLALYWDKDANGNEFTTTNAGDAYSHNRQATGSLFPKVYGGFGTQFKAYGFELSIDFGYQAGGKLIDETYYSLMYGGNAGNIGQAMHKDLLKAWTPDNIYTDVPRLSTKDQYTTGNSSAYTDRWLTSSNFLSINNITIGYSFKKAWIAKLGLEELRVYGSAENVAFWSARKGLDPRQGYLSSNAAKYSPSRVIMGGLRVAF